MWVFLATEILFFGGVLCAYWVYRVMYPEAWALGAQQQNKLYGGINTIVLIISSLTMALAVRNAQLGRRKATVAMLFATLVFGSTFLSDHQEHRVLAALPRGTLPRRSLHPGHDEVRALAPKVQLFMTFYWSDDRPARAAHGHRRRPAALDDDAPWRGDFGPEYYSPVEIMGLYWHFVDIVWIFLFPFLYLIPGGHHV